MKWGYLIVYVRGVRKLYLSLDYQKGNYRVWTEFILRKIALFQFASCLSAWITENNIETEGRWEL